MLRRKIKCLWGPKCFASVFPMCAGISAHACNESPQHEAELERNGSVLPDPMAIGLQLVVLVPEAGPKRGATPASLSPILKQMAHLLLQARGTELPRLCEFLHSNGTKWRGT